MLLVRVIEEDGCGQALANDGDVDGGLVGGVMMGVGMVAVGGGGDAVAVLRFFAADTVVMFVVM